MPCQATELLGWIERHPGTAAWVQAIGAIIALVVAILVPVWMARKADRLSRERFLESVGSISNEVCKCFVCGGSGFLDSGIS